MPYFHCPSPRMIFSGTDTSSASFADYARSALNIADPDTSSLALINAAEIRIDLDRTGIDTSGVMPWAVGWGAIVLPMYRTAWVSGGYELWSYTNSNYSTGAVSHGLEYFTDAGVSSLYGRLVSGGTARYWKFLFTGLTSPIKVAMALLGSTYTVTRMWNWNNQDTDSPAAIDLSNAFGMPSSQLARSGMYGSRSLFFELIGDADVAALRAIFAACYGPVFPFWMHESLSTMRDAQMYKFASVNALRIEPVAEGLTNVTIDIIRYPAIPTALSHETLRDQYEAPY